LLYIKILFYCTSYLTGDIAWPTFQVISVSISFGDQQCLFNASFSTVKDSDDALTTAVAIATASGDTRATVSTNGWLRYGNFLTMVPGGRNTVMALPLPSPTGLVPDIVGTTTVSTSNHHFINLIIEENAHSFAFNNGIWKLEQNFWFGTTEVFFSSYFMSHRVPLAYTRAAAMSKASGQFLGGCIVPPQKWVINLGPNYWER
jgi:hypothetical protein